MVKTIRLAAFVLSALACLAGCNLGVGIFPDRLKSYEAYADLTRFIDPDHVWNYNFEIIRDSRSGSGYPEYLVLVNDDRSFGGVHLAVFNTDLEVLGKYTIEQLDAMVPAPFVGQGAMVDADGYIVAGNRRFAVSSQALVCADSLSKPGRAGLAVPEATDPNIANIRCEGDDLRYQRYSLAWASITEETKNVGSGSWSTVAGFWHQGTDILFILFHDTPPAHIIRFAPVQFASGGYTAPIIGNVPTELIESSEKYWWETLGATTEGFAVFRGDTNQYIRFDLFGDEFGIPRDIPEAERPYDQRHVYGRTSGWYILDKKRVCLERRAWWWR